MENEMDLSLLIFDIGPKTAAVGFVLFAAIAAVVLRRGVASYLNPAAAEFKALFAGSASRAFSIIKFAKVATLLAAAIVAAGPRLKLPGGQKVVRGVSIMVALDLSGSMELFDDLKDRRSRIEVATAETRKLILRRENDEIGIVVFGADILTKAPLTLDKKILLDSLADCKVGLVNPAATALATGLMLATVRLKHARGRSRIVILVTDGRSTPQVEKVSIDQAIEAARKLGVKVYVVAVGNINGGFLTQAGGLVRVPDSVDTLTLKRIASETNGRFFRAQSPADMKRIYKTIDELEKTEFESNVRERTRDLFPLLRWVYLGAVGTYAAARWFAYPVM